MPRIIRIVFRPQDEWPRIAAERGHGAMLYAILLSLIPAAASFDSDLKMPESAVLAIYLACVLAVFSVAAAFWLLVKLDSRDESVRRCIQVAAYGATPFFLASALLVTPASARSSSSACRAARRRSSSPSRSSPRWPPSRCYRILAWTSS